jgi:large subunit ribosomal protein L17
MRHMVRGRQLSRDTEHRKALRRNMVQSLFEHGKIRTTLPKAKEVRAFAEKLITLAREGWNLNNFRRVLAVVTKRDVAYRLFHEIGPRFQGRPGGYTRIYKLAKVRQGDAAPMGVIALLGESEMPKAPTRPAVVGSRP